VRLLRSPAGILVSPAPQERVKHCQRLRKFSTESEIIRRDVRLSRRSAKKLVTGFDIFSTGFDILNIGIDIFIIVREKIVKKVLKLVI